jgi:hypothetical protein
VDPSQQTAHQTLLDTSQAFSTSTIPDPNPRRTSTNFRIKSDNSKPSENLSFLSNKTSKKPEPTQPPTQPPAPAQTPAILPPKNPPKNLGRNKAHDTATATLGRSPLDNSLAYGSTTDITVKSQFSYESLQENIIQNLLDVRSDSVYWKEYEKWDSERLVGSYGEILEGDVIDLRDLEEMLELSFFGYLEAIKGIQKVEGGWVMNCNLGGEGKGGLSGKSGIYAKEENFVLSDYQMQTKGLMDSEFLFRCVGPKDSEFSLTLTRNFDLDTEEEIEINHNNNYGVNRIIIFQIDYNTSSLQILNSNYTSTNTVFTECQTTDNEEFFIYIDQDINPSLTTLKLSLASTITLTSNSRRPLYIEFLKEKTELITSDVNKNLPLGLLTSYVNNPASSRKPDFDTKIQKKIFAQENQKFCYRFYGEMLGYIAYVYINLGEKD